MKSSAGRAVADRMRRARLRWLGKVVREAEPNPWLGAPITARVAAVLGSPGRPMLVFEGAPHTHWNARFWRVVNSNEEPVP